MQLLFQLHWFPIDFRTRFHINLFIIHWKKIDNVLTVLVFMWGLPKYKWIHTFHSLSIIVYLDHSAGWISNISFQLWPWNLRPSHFYFCFTFKSSTFHSLLQSGRFAPFCYLDWLCIVRLPTTFIFSLFTCLTCLNWIFAPIFSLFLYLLEI